MTDSREEKWIAAAREGDQGAFEELVLLYEKRVLALTQRMCGNPEDAAEAAQEAFLAAWQGLKNFRGDSSFSTWLYRLSSNACVDLLRREGRRFAGRRGFEFGYSVPHSLSPGGGGAAGAAGADRGGAPGPAAGVPGGAGAAGDAAASVRRDCPRAGAGCGDGQIPNQPGTKKTSKFFAGAGELFSAASV